MDEVIAGVRELICFVSIMARFNSKAVRCHELMREDNNWVEMDKIIYDLQDSETDMKYEDGKIVFNGKDITDMAKEWFDDYAKGNWPELGTRMGTDLVKVANEA